MVPKYLQRCMGWGVIAAAQELGRPELLMDRGHHWADSGVQPCQEVLAREPPLMGLRTTCLEMGGGLWGCPVDGMWYPRS